MRNDHRSLATLTVVAAVIGVGFLSLSKNAKVRSALYDNGNLPKVSIGHRAPDFSLSDYEGRRYQPRTSRDLRLSSLRGQWVVLFFLCGCSNCVEVASGCQQIHREKKATVLGIAGLNQAAVAEFRKETQTDFPILFDSSSRVAELYHSFACPTCWLIDPEGKIVYSSRDPEHPLRIIRKLRGFLGA